MKIIKLNSRGFSQDLLLIAIVVIVAISGVAFLVGSHADSLASSKITDPNAISCKILNVPEKFTAGTVIRPKVSFTNSSNKRIAVKGLGAIISFTSNGTSSKGGPVNATVKAHKTLVKTTGLRYTVKKQNPVTGNTVEFSVYGSPSSKLSFECHQVITLPRPIVI
jgi:hypothetical protein